LEVTWREGRSKTTIKKGLIKPEIGKYDDCALHGGGSADPGRYSNKTVEGIGESDTSPGTCGERTKKFTRIKQFLESSKIQTHPFSEVQDTETALGEYGLGQDVRGEVPSSRK